MSFFSRARSAGPKTPEGAPGPSPWYLRGRTLPSSRGDLRWESSAQPGEGGTDLLDPAGAVLARCGFYCYVLPLERTLFLVWTLEKRGEAQDVRFQVIDADRLTPLEPGIAPPSSLQISISERQDTRVSAFLPEGEHAVVLPSGLRSLPELLLWVQPTDSSGMPLRLWSLVPATGRLTVIRQKWFDSKSHDLGYEWATRVWRDAESGHVMGEGIRLGVFRLNASCDNVGEWLIQDHFYGPYG
jgi:hypothetical protein